MAESELSPEESAPLPSAQPNNPGYTAVFVLQDRILCFALADEPKSILIRETASLIIPPNNVVPIKDRLGIFNQGLRDISTEAEVLVYLRAYGEPRGRLC